MPICNLGMSYRDYDVGSRGWIVCDACNLSTILSLCKVFGAYSNHTHSRGVYVSRVDARRAIGVKVGLQGYINDINDLASYGSSYRLQAYRAAPRLLHVVLVGPG